MRHRLKSRLYGYKQGPEKALIRSLVYSLVENGRIKTTLTKAKEVRRHAEKALTQAKKNTLHSRRQLLARFPNKKVVSLLMDKVALGFKDRNGGCTRIVKTAPRLGDAAKMAFLEFVHYKKGDYESKHSLPEKKKNKGFSGSKKRAKKIKNEKFQEKTKKTKDKIEEQIEEQKEAQAPLLNQKQEIKDHQVNQNQKIQSQNETLPRSEDDKKKS